LLSIVFVLVSLPALAEEWTVSGALAKIDEQTRTFRTATADVTITRVGTDGEDRTGTVYVRSDGRLRLNVGEDSEPSFLTIPGAIYIHRPSETLVTRHKTGKWPEMLAQFALLGFNPRGTQWSKQYLVTLIGEEPLDSEQTLRFELTPSERRLRGIVSKIHVWISLDSWLPVQQTAFQGGPGKSTTARYRNLITNVEIDGARFKPKWPKGTKVVTR
jgi:outer membrane lipoprotein-sorting protein